MCTVCVRYPHAILTVSSRYPRPCVWQVLTGFTSEQRSQFLTFIWGRNRLPLTDEEWGEQCMKIHTLENPRPDGHFPVSHTCFFSMEWPRYSSVEVSLIFTNVANMVVHGSNCSNW